MIFHMSNLSIKKKTHISLFHFRYYPEAEEFFKSKMANEGNLMQLVKWEVRFVCPLYKNIFKRKINLIFKAMTKSITSCGITLKVNQSDHEVPPITPKLRSNRIRSNHMKTALNSDRFDWAIHYYLYIVLQINI